MFDYQRAFSRNIGWLTAEEQKTLKNKKVAIAGMGGVGGEHLVTLSRLGLQNFHIADFDVFEVHNFNRQAGAFLSTVDQTKCSVMQQIALDINPDCKVNVFEKGVNAENLDAFFDGVDVYVDSLDFFALDARIAVFNYCFQHDIPVVTAAPLGLGSSVLCFLPGKMNFEQYFRFNDKQKREEKLIQFLIGLSPYMLQRGYLVDPSTADFNAEKGPSTAMAVKLCAGLANTAVLKILLNRGKVICAPRGFHVDAYTNVQKTSWLPFGNRGLTQRIKFAIAKKILT